MSVSRPMFGVARPRFRAPATARQVALAHVGEDQVLLVRDAQLAEAEAVGQVGDESIWSAVASPGGTPVFLSDSVTRRSRALVRCTLRCSQRAKARLVAARRARSGIVAGQRS
jgi:hypothetical protein